jgi:hypothetical protein
VWSDLERRCPQWRNRVGAARDQCWAESGPEALDYGLAHGPRAQKIGWVTVANQLDVHPDLPPDAHRHQHESARVRQAEAQIAVRPGPVQRRLAVRSEREPQLARVGVQVAAEQRPQDCPRARPQRALALADYARRACSLFGAEQV